MERYERYIDSGNKWLGDIPASWTCGRVRSIYTLRKELVDNGEPEELVSVSEYFGVDYRRNRIGSSDVLARADSLEGYQLCYPGDLVMNIMLAWKGAQGTSSIKGLVSPSYGVFRPLNRSCSRYYHYLFRTDQYREYFKSYSSGIIDSRLRLYPEVFLHLNCHVPTLEEQQAIADYLDAKTAEIDALVADCEREVELLREYCRSVISEAVTKGLDPDAPMRDSGVEWIGEIPEGWSMRPIKEFCRLCTGHTPPTDNSDYFDGEIDWYTPGDISDRRLGRASRTISHLAIEDSKAPLYPADSVLLVAIGDAGRVGLCLNECSSNQQITALIPLKCSSDWLFYAMQAERTRLNNLALSTMIPILNNAYVSNYKLALPPIEQQLAIADYLDAKTAEIDALIDAKQQMADKLREYRKSLISEAVTGKFKVPGV